MYANTGLRTSILAYGFLYLKQDEDPLQQIQILDFMNLVSFNQIVWNPPNV